MLTAPQFTTIKGVTVFPDDSVWYRFYLIPANPSVRLNERGDPVFLLAKYAFSDDDRAADPKLPSGGGYMNFDVQFQVPPASLEEVRAELQDWVDDEWQRLRTGTTEERKRVGVAGNEAPRVEFGAPTWTQGKVAIDAPQSENLVEARVAEGVPSLLSGNTAVFSIDLTAAGASFMEKTLAGPHGDQGGNLAPIQVRYDLSFWARLPPVRIHVEADSEKIFNQVRKIMDGRGRDHCTTYDFAHSDITTQNAYTAGLIDVQIDTGSGSLSDELLEELRGYALGLVQQMIEASFFTESPEFDDGGMPDLDEDNNKKKGKKKNRKKYLRKNYDRNTMHIEVNLEQLTVVEWSIHPQTTLEIFLADRSHEELKQFIKTIDLDDDFFKHLGLETRVFADFSDPELDHVEVQLQYEGRDENGDHVLKPETLTFTDTKVQQWNPSLIGGLREYRYRYRVGYHGRERGAFSEWERSTSPDLNISVPSPGRVQVELVAGDVDFENQVENLQIQLAYEDGAAGIAREETTKILTASQRQTSYARLIYDFWRRPVQYKRRFKLKSGKVMEDEQWQEINGRQLVINQPFFDVLRVRLVPTGGGWDEVSQVHVQLRYRDPTHDYSTDFTHVLRNKDEFKTWEVVLQDPDKREFEYRISRAFTTARPFEQSDWITSAGETTIPVEVGASPGLRIQVLGDMLDFGTSPTTEVTLHYQQAGLDRTETFVFTQKGSQLWKLGAPEGVPLDYTYRVTHHPVDGDPVVMPEVREQDTVVVLQPYRPPKRGVLQVSLMGQLIDFAATPLVVVDLSYDDDENDVHEVASISFDAKGVRSWEIPVKDINQKQYSYKITYFSATGEEHAGERKFQEIPRVIIPKLVI